jgi:hypothetical protein
MGALSMAIAANTVTLADYAIMSNAPLVQKVTYSLILYSNILQDIPMITKKSFIINGVRFDGSSLPTINWSQLNAEPVTTKATPVPYQEQAFLLRNTIDVDKYLVEEENQIVDPRGTQVEAYLRALTYDINFKFFNNNHISGDSNAPIGIRYRIDNGAAYGVRSENKINGNIDISQATLASTPSNGNKLIELLDQLLWSVDSPDGDGVILYMNDTMKRRFNFILRALGTSGGLAITQDQFNRTISMYKGAVIRDPGYKADQTTRILTATEDTSGNDASSTYTSIYAVNYSEGHLTGWQFEPPNVQDLGLIYNGVIYRTLIDYACGFSNVSTRSLGRLYDLKVA